LSPLIIVVFALGGSSSHRRLQAEFEDEGSPPEVAEGSPPVAENAPENSNDDSGTQDAADLDASLAAKSTVEPQAPAVAGNKVPAEDGEKSSSGAGKDVQEAGEASDAKDVKGIVEEAPGRQRVEAGGEGTSKDKEEEKRPKPVHITYRQQLLLSRLNNILNNSPTPDPNLLLRLRPDSFSEDLSVPPF
jgi:hypothetical protein